MKYDAIPMHDIISLFSPYLGKMEQLIAAGVVTPAVEQNLLLAGHTVVWVEADIDVVAHLPDKYLIRMEVFDILPDRVE